MLYEHASIALENDAGSVHENMSTLWLRYTGNISAEASIQIVCTKTALANQTHLFD